MDTRATRGLAIAVAVLVVLAVVAGVLAALRPGPELPGGSPEARVRDYVAALYERDPGRAVRQLDPDGLCTEGDLRDVFLDERARVVLRESTTEGGTARVRVDLVHAGEGPFGGGENREPVTFDLRRDGDRWVITGEPWPTFSCGKNRELP